MRLIFLNSILFLQLWVIAQPVIDSTNYTPKMWEMFERKKCNMTTINYRSSSAGYTWNFINAPVSSTDTLLYDSIDANNCNYNHFLFMYNAGWVGQIALINLNSVDNSLPSYATDYKMYTINGLYETGGSDCPQPLGQFSYMSFPFPLTVTTNYSVTEFYTGTNFSPPNTSNYKWDYSLVADGYGTLNLPTGITYTNCLRLRQIMFDNPSNVVVDTMFYWLTPGMHHPVLQVQTNAGSQEYGYYISATGSVASVKKFTADNLQLFVYPNPASSFINIQSSTELNTVIIYNSLGSIVYHAQEKNIQLQVDLSKFPSGIYTVQAQGRNVRIIKE